MSEPRGPRGNAPSCVAQSGETQSSSAVVLPRGRLDRLARAVGTLYRKAHLTVAEARYVHKRARALAGGRSGGGPQRPAGFLKS